MVGDVTLDFDVPVPENTGAGLNGAFDASTQRIGSSHIHFTAVFEPQCLRVRVLTVPGGLAESEGFGGDGSGWTGSGGIGCIALSIQTIVLNSFGIEHAVSIKKSSKVYTLGCLSADFDDLMPGPYTLQGLKQQGWVTQNNKLRIRIKFTGDEIRKFFNCEAFAGPHAAMAKDMWENREYEDFYIEANTEKIKCHRSVLMAASPVFKAMLQFKAMQQHECREVPMSHVSVDEGAADITALLQYMYLRTLPLDMDCSSLLSLLRLGDVYQVPDLVDSCAARLGPMLTSANIVEVFQLLRSIRNGNKKNDSIFHSMMAHVRDRPNLLEAMSMSCGIGGSSRQDGNKHFQRSSSPTHPCVKESDGGHGRRKTHSRRRSQNASKDASLNEQISSYTDTTQGSPGSPGSGEEQLERESTGSTSMQLSSAEEASMRIEEASVRVES